MYSRGTWCSGITSASHAEGPGFNPQCVHFSDRQKLKKKRELSLHLHAEHSPPCKWSFEQHLHGGGHSPPCKWSSGLHWCGRKHCPPCKWSFKPTFTWWSNSLPLNPHAFPQMDSHCPLFSLVWWRHFLHAKWALSQHLQPVSCKMKRLPPWKIALTFHQKQKIKTLKNKKCFEFKLSIKKKKKTLC